MINKAILISFFFPVMSLMAVQLRKPQMMPCVILYEKGMITIARNAGMASSSCVQLIFVTGCTINTPTNTRAGAVAMAGTSDNNGAKNKKGKKSNAPAMAVSPVLPLLLYQRPIQYKPYPDSNQPVPQWWWPRHRLLMPVLYCVVRHFHPAGWLLLINLPR